MFTIRLRGGQLSYVEQALFDRITDQRPPDNPTDELARPAVITRSEPLNSSPTGPKQYTFTLRDGRKIRGELVRQDSTGTIVRTRNIGEVRIPTDQLLKRETLAGASSVVTTSDLDATYVVTLTDKRQFRGTILQQDSLGLLVRTKDLGDVRVPANQITRLVKVRNSPSAAAYSNLFTQSLFWAPTAFMPERGKAYFSQQFTTVSQFDVGLTENWSIGGSFFTFIPSLGYSFSTKVAFPVTDRLRLGAQAQYAGLGYPIDPEFRSGIGYLQGIATLGSAEQNTTLGVGWTVSNGDLSRNALVMLGFVRKVGPKTTFISQNQVVLKARTGNSFSLALASAGVRFNRRNQAFDVLGCMLLLGFRNQVYPVPSVWATYRLRINP